jgi:chromosome segregation ATPase
LKPSKILRGENVQKKIIIIAICFFAVIAICGIAYGANNKNKYEQLRATIEAANTGELQQQLGLVTAELERTKSALNRSEQSVGELAELDQRRLAGVKRIRAIIDNAGKSISGITSGEQRTRIALETIARIIDELEKEFGGGAE